MNKPMTTENHGAWIFNAVTEHLEEKEVRIHTPREKTIILQCHCLSCLEKNGIDLSMYLIGKPMQLSYSFPTKKLEEMGIVGIYEKPNENEETSEST